MRRLRSVLGVASAVLLAALVVTGCASANAASSIAVASAYVQLRAPLSQHAGVLTMHSVPDIAIPADSMTLLNPDTDHLLIKGAGPMHDGKDIMLRLTFANAGTVTVIALVTNPQSGGSSYFLN